MPTVVVGAGPTGLFTAIALARRGHRVDHAGDDLLDPAEGIAPGQAVVVYDGSRVVGSATITRTRGAA